MQLITLPSKTQRFNGRAGAGRTFPALLEKTGILVHQQRLLGREELSCFMPSGARGTIIDFTLRRHIGNAAELNGLARDGDSFSGETATPGDWIF